MTLLQYTNKDIAIQSSSLTSLFQSHHKNKNDLLGLVYNKSNREQIGFCDSENVNNYLTCIENLEDKSQNFRVTLLHYCLCWDE